MSSATNGGRQQNSGTKRKYHSKSRKGCSTCKRRRVKCDETKPKCNNCSRMKLDCGFAEFEGPQNPPLKKFKEEEQNSVPAYETPQPQQATPDKSPSPLPAKASVLQNLTASVLGSGLLGTANLNNLNLSLLVNSISNLGDISALGDVGNLSNLALLAQSPVDLNSLLPQLSEFLPRVLPATTPNPNSDPQEKAQNLADGPKTPSVLPNAASASNTPGNVPTGILNENLSDGMELKTKTDLNMTDLRLMHHYTTKVSITITGAGISDTDIWNNDIPKLAFEYPFLMHALLAFSATHLSRTESGLDHCVTKHRGEALHLLREEILNINLQNTDALVASALILIMDSLANASAPSLESPKSLPASAWIFHVKGAATILTAVWPLTEASRFYKFIGVDLGDLGDIINQKSQVTETSLSFANLVCHDSSIADLYPVPINSPYLITLAYLNKLHKERYKADFILRIFAFPALLEKDFLGLLMSGDVKAMRIMRSYYKLLRSFTSEMKDKVWFLEGVSSVLPVDVEEYAGGAGGMHMMLDFLGGGPAIAEDHEVDKDLSIIDPGGKIAEKLIDTNNLPSDITSNLDIMQGDAGLMEIKLE